MAILGQLSSHDFIAQYWQKEPLVVRNALAEIQGLVDGDDLAGLAGEDDVESRLIGTDEQQTDWRCEHGPFDEQQFASLPAQHWTLLVQAVDQWIPEVAAILTQFAFLPRWRLDDVMISYATPGGGVGPHFDHYDVFLLQAKGRRQWRLGQRCDEHTPLRDHPQLKLLQDFKVKDDYELAPGDMLYLPAGVAHWGTAITDDCITYSIGFRAPSHKEIMLAAIEKLTAAWPENQRYRDTPQAIDPDPFCINAAVLQQLESLCQVLTPNQSSEALAQTFGCQVTEPRYPELIEPETNLKATDLSYLVSQNTVIQCNHNPASRFAYRIKNLQEAELYVDGDNYPSSLALAQAICRGRIEPQMMTKTHHQDLLLQLINQGSLLLCDPPDRL